MIVKSMSNRVYFYIVDSDVCIAVIQSLRAFRRACDWRLGGLVSVRSDVSCRMSLFGRIGLIGWIGVFGWMFFLIILLLIFVFFHQIFDVFLDSGITFLMKLRSRGLLFREKGSVGDLRGSWGPKVAAKNMLLGVLGSILGGIFDQKSIKNRYIF